MRHLIIKIFIFILLYTTTLYGGSHKGETLYGWETTSGVKLRDFGDKDIHPQYTGDVENGKPNGLGIMTYPDGRKFLGEYKDGKKDGHGTFTFTSGIKYVGEFKDDKMWNVIKFNKYGQYVGEFKDGEVWNGLIYDKNGIFIGKWLNGVKQ